MTIRHRPDRDRYVVDVSVSGQRVRRQALGLQEAERIERALVKANAEGGFWLPLNACMRDYIATLRTRAKRNSVRFAEQMEDRLVKHFGEEANVAALTQADLDGFVAARRAAGWSTSSINGALRILRAATNFAEREGKLRTPPSVRLLREGKRRPTILVEDQVVRLLAEAPAPVNLAFALAAYAGLRHQEILHLTVGDVDFANDVIRVTPKPHVGWSPKAYHEREIPLHPALRKALASVCERRHHAVWIFPGKREGWPRLTLAKEVREAFQRLGLWNLEAKPGLHMLRRSFASELLGKGADLRTVMEICGWSSIAVAERYLASTDDRKRAAVARAFK
jgi:integrase/recombinase XerD